MWEDTILRIAELVKDIIPSEIIVSESNDPRSYRQDSSKLLKTGLREEYQNHLLEK